MPFLASATFLAACLVLATAGAASGRDGDGRPASPGRFEIHRGTNVSHWLSQSDRRGEERRRWFTRDDAVFLARLGFDHLRIPVDEEQLWDDQGRPIAEAFGLLDAALDWTAELGLRAIVDLHILRSHHFNAKEKPLWTQPETQRHFLALWTELSARLHTRRTDLVAYELMNEPVADDPEAWNRLLADAYRTVRQLEPERVLVIGSNLWQSPATFDVLRVPPGDPRIILSFHFYSPMALTHYGASWTKAGEYRGPVRYPGRVVEDRDTQGLAPDLVASLRDSMRVYDRDVLASLIERPRALAAQTGLPLYCGEWGALVNAPRADRLRWYADVRSMLEKHGVAWAAWDYKGGFGIVDDDGRPDFGLIETLFQAAARRDEPPHDWAQLARYRDENRRLPRPAAGESRVVFLGDSITDMWQQPQHGGFFPGKPYVDRGIGGQTTPQMLVRFRPDVIDLAPSAVVILAGTNDIAGNTGPMTDEEIEGNLATMCELAAAHDIRVVLSSVLPVSAHHYEPGAGRAPQTALRPMARIRRLNDWMQKYAAEHGHTYLDYFSAMTDETGHLRAELSQDDLHPNAKGYAIMAPLAEVAVGAALRH
jgi:endoglucanase